MLSCFMLPRTTALELFSTFIQFSNDRFEAWITDSQLRKSMTNSLSQEMPQPQRPDAEQEGFWALYWFQQWQKKEGQARDRKQDSKKVHPFAAQHLSAYLQEPCYWAVESITRRFVSARFSVADGFQGAIAQVDRILTRYNPTYGSSLKAYARTAFSNFIRDYLRQQKAADICSDWALLRRLSQTQLRQALLTAGFVHIETDIAIWQCFKAVCIPDAEQISHHRVRALAQPSDERYTQIAERYQQLASSGTRDGMSNQISGKVVAASLKRSIQAARAYLNPSVISLNQSAYGPSAGTDFGQETELLNTLGIADGETPMAQMMAAEAYAEQQANMMAIGEVLQGAIAALEPSQQTILQLYYQEQLTQKEIAQQLGIKQYQVSRQLSRLRQQLLLAVAEWSQNTLHISVESAVLATISETIHEWLQQAYSADQAQIDPSNRPQSEAPT